MVLIVTRHDGAVEWLSRQGIYGNTIAHLTPDDIAQLRPDDIVVGVVPLNLAADLYERGVRVLSIIQDTRLEDRGRELTADEMEMRDAHLEEFVVRRLGWGKP